MVSPRLERMVRHAIETAPPVGRKRVKPMTTLRAGRLLAHMPGVVELSGPEELHDAMQLFVGLTGHRTSPEDLDINAKHEAQHGEAGEGLGGTARYYLRTWHRRGWIFTDTAFLPITLVDWDRQVTPTEEAVVMAAPDPPSDTDVLQLRARGFADVAAVATQAAADGLWLPPSLQAYTNHSQSDKI